MLNNHEGRIQEVIELTTTYNALKIEDLLTLFKDDLKLIHFKKEIC